MKIASLFLSIFVTSSLADHVCYHQGEKHSNCAAVEDYIEDLNCKENYIRTSKKACVTNGKCHPHGTHLENNCDNIEMWHWFDSSNPKAPGNYAPGVHPHPAQRITAKGHDKQNLVWAYTSAITQGEAAEAFNKEGQVDVDMLLNTPVNHITFIANVLINQSSHWFRPGVNNTDGCGQKQTWELPFGFQGNARESLPTFQKNLKTLHESGLTITLTMGSWCTQFPVLPKEEWTEQQFTEFVDYFKAIRQDIFGGALDGIDFDWEGYCNEVCLKEDCTCEWSDQYCSQFTPEELAEGKSWTDTDGSKKMCWMMATKSTMQVMTGITKYMKDAGFVVTLVPMSTQVYSGEEDKSTKQVMRNEMVKWRKQTYAGQDVDLLEMSDGILLQWYSGFDASLCLHSDDPTSCTCHNEELPDYPNVVKVKHEDGRSDGMLTWWGGSNIFSTSFPVRCQACGPNVLLPDGTRGNFPCAPPDEEYFRMGNVTKDPSLITEHNERAANYTKTHNGSIPYWWPINATQPSRCPRAIDCPDWRYKGEEPYSRQLKLLLSIGKVTDLSKVAIGFETLATDLQFQFQSWADHTEPWDTVTQNDMWVKHHFHDKCTQNMTKDNINDGKRCGQPLVTQQWGLKFNASEILGLTAAVQKATGKTLAGIGMFTLDGVLAVKGNNATRLWCPELLKLNKTYQIPCHGDACGSCGGTGREGPFAS